MPSPCCLLWRPCVAPLFASCVLLSIVAEVPAQTPIEIVPDVVYGHKDGLAMTFDVFKPTENSNGAAVVFMVSGGWRSRWTPPEATRGFFEPFLVKGFTVLSVRHGSSPKYGIPDAVSDVRRAIRFIRLHADDYGIDEKRIGVFGMSAGGHLSLMLATTGDDGQSDSTDPVLKVSNRVKSVAAVVPPSDLRIAVWSAPESLPAYRNYPALDMSVEQAAEYSPLLFVTKDDAPALIVSGSLDELVPPKHGQWIADAYEKEGLPHKFLLLETNHGLQNKRAEVMSSIVEWFAETLQAE